MDNFIDASGKRLAPYAADPMRSRGRLHPESLPQGRDEFQRDRDRIVHSAAFRRLEYKTQVFVNHEGDLFRTRLTHSIEVAQIARTIARQLRLNEDLTEAISLAHDLGHTPFGHAGQDALNLCMQPWGGFEHNLQSLRVVDELEERYGDYDGLNLCFETREGVLKHCSLPNAARLGEIGLRFIERRRPSLEAQLANLADQIAYVNHDVDDGLRSGLLKVSQLMEVELFGRHHRVVLERFPQLGERRQVYETVRRMINELVLDLTACSQALIDAAAPGSIDDVRAAPALIAFSGEVGMQSLALKHFLFENLYRHYRVVRMTSKAARVVAELFEAFVDDIRLLPDEHKRKAERDRHRAVADYIAGMTDRYAIKEHRRLFSVDET
jgi:dGTPase